MNNKHIKAIISVIVSLILIISVSVVIVYGINCIIFAIRNPKLTQTQLFLHFMKDTLCGKWVIIAIISYMILIFSK